MDESTEKVKYVFEGDTSDLRDATVNAIDLLGRFDQALKQAVREGRADIGVGNFKNFQKSANAAIKQANALAKGLQSSSNEVVNSLSKESSTVNRAASGIAAALNKLDTANTVSDYKAMTSALMVSTKQLESVSTKVKLLSTDLKSVASGSDLVKSKVKQMASSVVKDTSTVQSTAAANVKAFTQAMNAESAKAFAKEFEASSGRAVKSAQESAQAFMQMESSANRATNVRNLGTTLGNVVSTFQDAASKASFLGDSFRASFNKMTASTQTLKSKMQSMMDSFTSSSSKMPTRLSSISEAFRRTASTTSDADAAASKASKSHKALDESVNKLSSDVKKETREISFEKNTLKQKNSVLKDSERSHNALVDAVTSLGRSIRTDTANISRYTSNMRNLSSVSNTLKQVFVALSGVQIGDWLAQGTKSAIDYVENLNLFTVAMGSSIDRGMDFIYAMQEIYGMDPSNLYRYAGYFYQLTDAIGMTDAASASMSLSLTKASNDIASLFNVDIETVTEDLASGLQGMSRAVRKYGMDIRVTTLQETALQYGLTEQVETMSEANRMALRFITMMQQAENALHQTTAAVDGTSTSMGDFARNIETPANQLRIFKEQISQLGRAIGNFIVTPFAKAIAYVNGFIMALRMAINFVGNFFDMFSGGQSTSISAGLDDVAGSVTSVGDAASGAAKQMQDMLAPFDELNVLQEPDTSAGGGDTGGGVSGDTLDPALADALENMELSLDNVRMKANEVRDAILEFMGFKIDGGEIISWDSTQLEENLINKFPQWTESIKALFDNWTEIVNGFKAVFNSLGDVFAAVWEKISAIIGVFINDTSVSTFISGLADSLNSLATWISDNSDGIANFVLILGGLWAGFKVFSGLATILGPIVQVVTTLASAGTSLLTFVGIATAVAAAVAVLYQNSQDFATSFNNLFAGVGDGLGQIFEAIKDSVGGVWTSLQDLWNEHLQPMLEATGDALAPVLDTIGTLWSYVADIISQAIRTMSDLWVNTLSPVFGAIFDGISTLMGIFKQLWEGVIGPVIEYIGAGIADLWESTLSPIISKVIEIVGGVIEIVMALWNNVLGPLVSWLVDSLAPSFQNVFQTIWDIISKVFENIGGVIQGLLTSLGGLIDFIVGIFTGDWDRAWRGIVNVFIGLCNGIISVFETVVNAIISLVNGLISLIYNAIVGLINLILGAVEGIAGLLGFDLELGISGEPPAIPYLSIPKIPEMATGGVVTGPTTLLAGEGEYSEAILPLDNSPQMQDLIDKIADKVNNPDQGKSNPVEVRVFIGGREWDAFTYESSQRGKDLVGAQPIKVGG